MKLFESHANGVTKGTNGLFRVRLISEGQGSSGFYTAELLERDLATALPKGTKVYFDHMSEEESWSGRARSMQNLVGVFEDDPVVENGEGHATVRFYKNSPTYTDVPAFIAEAMEDIGVSIEIHSGVVGPEGVVEALHYSPHNSLAVVTNPGARGRVEALAENFRTPVQEDKASRERQAMTPEDIQAINAPILAAISALTESLKPQDDGDEGPAIADIAEAVATSGLTEHGRKAVYAQVESGVAVEEAIKVEKARETAILETLKTDQAGLIQEAGSTDFDAEFAKFLGGN